MAKIDRGPGPSLALTGCVLVCRMRRKWISRAARLLTEVDGDARDHGDVRTDKKTPMISVIVVRARS